LTIAYPGRPIPSWNPGEIERHHGIEQEGWERGSVTIPDAGPGRPWPWQLPLPERIAHYRAEAERYAASAARYRQKAQEPGASMWSEIAALADDASAASAARQLDELMQGLEVEG